MSSWKTYGGINKFDKSGQISADSITVNNMTLRQAYQGDFDICGQLFLSGNAILYDSINVGRDANVYGNMIIGHNDTLGKSATVLNVTSTATFFGDIISKKNFIVDGAIVGNNIAAVNNVSVGRVLDFSGGSFFYSSGNALGLNTMTPKATLDISTSLVNAIYVNSYNIKNENVLSQNVNGRGIVLGTDTNSTYINYYYDHSITSGLVDTNISLTSGGYLNVDVSKNLKISAPVTIGKSVIHPYNDMLTVYDVSQGVYFGNIYQNNTAYTGAAASFIADSSGSDAFVYIGTPSLNGAAIGGGAYPDNINRSFATIGLTDTTGSYTPAQTIVSGINTPYHTTTGINTFKPKTEQCVLDVNGPIHIDNGDVTSIVTTPPFELYSISSVKGVVTTALGSSINVYNDRTTQYPKERIITTKNNGISWNYIDISNEIGTSTSVLKGNVLTSIFLYDANNWFITGSNNSLITSYDGGNSWKNISTGIEGIPTFNNIVINQTGNTITGNVLGYFSIDISSSLVIFEWPKTQANTVAFSKQIINTPIRISSISVFSKTIYIAGNSIVKYNASSTVNQTPVLAWNHPYGTYSYNEVKVFDNSFAIAVGGNIISSTPDGGTTWYDITFNTLYSGSGVNFKSIYIANFTTAVAVGSKGNIWVTNNKGLSWSPISTNLINSSGKGGWLLNSANNLRNITMSDSNTMMITSVIQSYNYNGNIYGNSQIFSVFSPNFMNQQNNFVLDISGTTRISGDLQINDGGGISSNNETFNLLNNGVHNINLGGDTYSITIGNATVGDMHILSSTNITNTSPSTTSTTGALIVGGGVGISGNLNIGGYSNISKDMVVGGNITNNNNLTVNKVLNVNGNINIKGHSNVSSDSSFFGNVAINSTNNSSAYNTGALVVAGGVGIAGKLNVNDNVNLTATTNTSTMILNGNLYTTARYFSMVPATTSVITIGGLGDYDQVIINKLSSTSSVVQTTNSKTIFVNNNIGNASSAGAGISIIDNAVVSTFPDHESTGNVWAYMRVGQDLQSFIFKAPSFGTSVVGDLSGAIHLLSPENKLRVAVNELSLGNIFNTNIKRALVMLQPDADFKTYQASKQHSYGAAGDADYAINICPDFDISNILLKGFDTDSGTQTIFSNLNIGNVSLSYNLNVFGNAIIGNAIIGNSIFVSNNIGVGNQNPSVFFDVSGASRFVGPMTVTNYDTLGFNTKYGANWINNTAAFPSSDSYFQDVAMSYDSKYQYGLVYNKYGYGSINRSVDNGSSWNTVNLPQNYSGNVINQAVPYMNANVVTFRFQDLNTNITIPNAQPLNIQIGKYTISASNIGIGQPYIVFGNYPFNSGNVWSPSTNLITSTLYQINGDYNGTVATIDANTTQTVLGEYIQVNLSYSFILKNYQHYPLDFGSNRYTNTMYVFGSNDSINWYNLTIAGSIINNNTAINSGNTYVSVPNNIAYNTYRFIINKAYQYAVYPSISRIDLSGIFQNVTGSFASSIATSSNGQYITVANQGYYYGTGNLYTSSNYGQSFSDSSQKANAVWQNVAISKTGSIQAAIGINRSGVGDIFLSTNSGVSWASVLNKPNGWQTISMSSTGQYMTAIQTGNIGGNSTTKYKGNIWTSSNYGASWSSNQSIYNYVQTVNGFLNLGAADFNKTVCVSSTGQYQTVLALPDPSHLNTDGNIWVSSNYGGTWSDTEVNPPIVDGYSSIFSSVSMVGTGQNQIVSFIGGNTGSGYPTGNVFGGVLTSSNYGQSWTNTLFNVPSLDVGGNTYYGYFQKVISSSTGQINIAMPKYQDLNSYSYNNTNNTAVVIGNLFSTSIGDNTNNIFSAQYFGSSNMGSVLQTHGFKVAVPLFNNAALMVGYDLDYNSSYINSGDQYGPTPLLLNTIGGNVAIGKTNPSYTLDVNGIVNASSLYINGLPLSNTGAWSSNGNIYYYNNGPVGVGTSSPEYDFDVSGNIRATNQINAGSFNATSDYRIKENICLLNHIYNVDGLRPVSFYNKMTHKNDIGFIAHEVQEQFPQLVNGMKDGDENQVLNYLGFIGILVKEVQDLKQENVLLKLRMDTIEKSLLV